MLRSIGDPIEGAVFVTGGAEYVRDPRLPIEPPDPARASANDGANARPATSNAVNTAEERRIEENPFWSMVLI